MSNSDMENDGIFADEFDWSAGLDKGGEDKDNSPPKVFYGKYRGMVINNVDPYKQGRMLVQVPDVLGLGVSSWALPCMPFTGIESGVYAVPLIGSGVWVEFEQGNPDKPIWVGCYWGSTAEVPKSTFPTTPGLPAFIVQTPGQAAVIVHDTPVPPGVSGGVVLKSATSSISIGPDGITIVAPNINILGNINALGTHSFNAGALTIT